MRLVSLFKKGKRKKRSRGGGGMERWGEGEAARMTLSSCVPRGRGEEKRGKGGSGMERGGGPLVKSARRDADFTGRVLACLQIWRIAHDAPE